MWSLDCDLGLDTVFRPEMQSCRHLEELSLDLEGVFLMLRCWSRSVINLVVLRELIATFVKYNTIQYLFIENLTNRNFKKNGLQKY